jgi:hypothetical protein
VNCAKNSGWTNYERINCRGAKNEKNYVGRCPECNKHGQK